MTPKALKATKIWPTKLMAFLAIACIIFYMYRLRFPNLPRKIMNVGGEGFELPKEL